MTVTSSHPSSPQLSRICLVACTSSGTVAYSHFGMNRTLRLLGHLDGLGSLGRQPGTNLRYRRLVELRDVRVADRRRLGLGDLGVAEVRWGLVRLALTGRHPVEEPQQLDWDRHDQRTVLLRGDLHHRLE